MLSFIINSLLCFSFEPGVKGQGHPVLSLGQERYRAWGVGQKPCEFRQVPLQQSACLWETWMVGDVDGGRRGWWETWTVGDVDCSALTLRSPQERAP